MSKTPIETIIQNILKVMIPYTENMRRQLKTRVDYQFNVWSHRHIYKYDNAEIGRKMYQLYCENQIETQDDFLKKSEEMRGAING